MVRVPGGSVQLGFRGGYPDEAPSGKAIRVDAFWMDRTEVINAQFAEFVRATGYTTQAEREGAAAVFRAQPAAASARPSPWWVWLRGASWRLPEGPGREPARPNEPVVMVTYQDALAYPIRTRRDSSRYLGIAPVRALPRRQVRWPISTA